MKNMILILVFLNKECILSKLAFYKILDANYSNNKNKKPFSETLFHIDFRNLDCLVYECIFKNFSDKCVVLKILTIISEKLPLQYFGKIFTILLKITPVTGPNIEK